MESRMPNPGAVLPDAQAALLAFAEAAGAGGLAQSIKDLVHLRASQINGCSVCAHLHATEMKSRGNSDDRIYAVAAWRDAPFFTEQERAALDLTEHATRLADRSDPVPAEVFDAAAKQFGESELASLVLHIALINAFNRISVTTGGGRGRVALIARPSVDRGHRRREDTAMPTARLLAAVPAVAPPAAGPTTVHTGEIGGAEFVVNVPDRWNGTLVLWSHGWYRDGFLPADPARQQTR